MAIVYLLGWWYGQGWAWVLQGILKLLQAINQTFSVAILLRTIFAPWKQIQSPKSFHNFFQSTLDNFVSRWIGATIRLGMLFVAGIFTFLLMLAGVVAALVWPLLPLLAAVLPIMAITGTGM